MFHILKYVWFVFLLVLKNIYQDKNVNLMPLKMSCDVTQEKLTFSLNHQYMCSHVCLFFKGNLKNIYIKIS